MKGFYPASASELSRVRIRIRIMVVSVLLRRLKLPSLLLLVIVTIIVMVTISLALLVWLLQDLRYEHPLEQPQAQPRQHSGQQHGQGAATAQQPHRPCGSRRCKWSMTGDIMENIKGQAHVSVQSSIDLKITQTWLKRKSNAKYVFIPNPVPAVPMPVPIPAL